MSKFLIFFLTCTLSISLYAKEIEGINIEEKRSFDKITLNLNGAGVRSKFFMDLYIASLYTNTSYPDATTLVKANSPMGISLHIISSLITSEKMENATLDGFESATNGNTSSIEKEIKEFIQVFKEPIKINDVYDLMYLPKDGVKIYKNKTLKATISKLEFKQALFGIWLGEAPAQSSLKKDMLGK